MIKEFYTLFLVVFIISCNQVGSRVDNEVLLKVTHSSNSNQISNRQNFKLDRVEIRVVSFTRPVLEATYVIENNCIDITSVSVDGDSTKEVCEEETISQIKCYLSKFYIVKEEKIELKRTKSDYIESTDYPYIKVIGYRGGKEVFTTETQIGEEDYDVKYNPQFLEFYEFLDSLVKKE